MPYQCSPRKIQLLLLVLAAAIIVSILMVLFLFNYPAFARQRVIDEMVFKNGTMEFERFQTTVDLKNLRLVFNIFNVTNMDEVVENGAKIRLQEVGPYVYHEFKHKEIISNNESTGLITFKLRKRYTFLAQQSRSDPKKDVIYWPNIPVVVLQSLVDNLPFVERLPARAVLNSRIRAKGEPAFIQDTVENFLFNGSHRTFFEDLQKQSFNLFKPWPLKDNKFAILYDKNDTWTPGKDYLYSVSSGAGGSQTYRDLNQYVLINGSSTLPYWNQQPPMCNQLHGTDGEFFSPFLNDSQDLEVYAIDLCRKLNFKYRQPSTISGVNVYKYTLDPKSLQSGQKNPENQCYCLQKGDEQCDLDGLVDLSSCIASNIVGSGSHFLFGSPELWSRIDGVRSPNLTLDEPYIYVEPNTGLTIQVRTPIQLNVRMQTGALQLFNFLQDQDRLIVPLLTVAETAELMDDQACLLRNKLLLLDSWLISTVLGGTIIFVISIIVVGVVLCMRHRDSKAGETDPLISRANSSTRVNSTSNSNNQSRASPVQNTTPQNYRSV